MLTTSGAWSNVIQLKRAAQSEILIVLHVYIFLSDGIKIKLISCIKKKKKKNILRSLDYVILGSQERKVIQIFIIFIANLLDTFVLQLRSQPFRQAGLQLRCQLFKRHRVANLLDTFHNNCVASILGTFALHSVANLSDTFALKIVIHTQRDSKIET